jgi:hypothetical protein
MTPLRRVGAIACWVSSALLAPPEPHLVSDTFHCSTLHATVRARVCIVRQLRSEEQVTRDTWRGQGSDYPSCTQRCAQGCAIRAALGGELLRADVRGPLRGSRGFGLRRRERPDLSEQVVARARLRVVGLLEIPPSLDEPPPDQVEGEQLETAPLT